MNNPDALDRAIAAHAKWKYRLMEAIETGRSEWRVGDVRSDSHCEFGKWLSALPLTDRLSAKCQDVRAKHADFHALAAEILELALAGRKREAAEAITPRSRFAGVSSSLTMAVIAWKEASGHSSENEA